MVRREEFVKELAISIENRVLIDCAKIEKAPPLIDICGGSSHGETT